MPRLTCNVCGTTFRAEHDETPICEDCYDESYELDLSPTGHGDECYSDADPGL